ncbi:MAG: esterase-like activity of phytase family protein [Alphaproteobacteria bacterium]|nr:esterase-like activity of phytase family protein [Alphaproteobacteria bacterium]
MDSRYKVAMRPLFPLALLCLLFLDPIADAAADWPIEVETAVMPLDVEDPERTTVGKLRYRGGLRLRGGNRAFGGFSALSVSPDGQAVLALSDTGRWFRARPIYVNGRLAGLTDTRMGAMRDLKGRRLRGRNMDAEAMTRSPDGRVVAAFERLHRLWRYDVSDWEGKRPEAMATPPGVTQAPGNGGMEAIATLSDGRYLVLTESLDLQPGLVRGWVGDGVRWQPLSYATDGGFRPTGADTLPNGDVVVIERRFTVATGPAARLRRLAAATIQADARLSPDHLATLLPPLLLDNFEGVAARRGAQGETLIYLISDDNFNRVQQTLLVMFELIED